MSLGEVLPMPGTEYKNIKYIKINTSEIKLGLMTMSKTVAEMTCSPLNVNSSVFLVSGSFKG